MAFRSRRAILLADASVFAARCSDEDFHAIPLSADGRYYFCLIAFYFGARQLR